MIIEETIPQALDNERLDRIVALILDVSRADAAVLVEAGGASIDGQSGVSGKTRLTLGQVVSVDPSFLPVAPRPAPDATLPLDVVYFDDDVIVVNKRAGVVVHPGAGNNEGTLVNALLAQFPEIADVGEVIRPGIVHRLDIGTSGLLVVARSETAYTNLTEALSRHEVEREYIALAWGAFDSPTGVIEASIGRDHRDPLRMAVVREGKWARTHFAVEETFNIPAALTRLRCTLETGRTHQIRVHLLAVGHPVVGDATYGGAKSALVAPRPMLHATRLKFAHPVSEVMMEFVAEIPDDMREILSQCGNKAVD